MRMPASVTLLLAAGLAAQTTDFAALDAELRFRLDEQGQIMLSPDPSAGGASDEFVPLVDLQSVLQNGGVLGWLAIVYQGAGDIASLADGEAILRRLGRLDDAALFTTITDAPVARHGQLLRLLAIRYVADRDRKPALGPLQKVAGDAATDPLVRRAAEEAIATLRGQPLPPPPRNVAAVGAALAGAPADLDLVWKVDHWRLPPGRILLRLARETGLAVTQRAIRAAGGSVSPAQWAGAVRLAEGVGALPYEAARRFGNHRFDRTLTALCVPDDGGEPEVWIRCDGRFEVDALRAGLAELDIDFTGDGSRLVLEPEAGTRIVVEPEQMTMTTMRSAHERLGDERAREFAAEFDRPEPIVVHLREGAELPELPPPLQGFGLPRSLALALPTGAGEAVEVRVDGADQALRALIQGQAESLPRLLDGWLDGVDDPEPFEPLVDALEAMELEVGDDAVTVRLPLAGVDFEALLRAAVESGAL